MGRARRARQINRYSEDFKLSAVRLSKLPGVQVNRVAEALDIHRSCLRNGERNYGTASFEAGARRWCWTNAWPRSCDS